MRKNSININKRSHLKGNRAILLLGVIVLLVAFLGLVSALPTISISSPSSLVNYGKVDGNLLLNFTATSVTLAGCWYNYNGINTTLNTLTNLTDANSVSQTSTAEGSSWWGFSITPNSDRTNVIITKNSSTTATKLRLLWSNATVIETDNFVSVNATLSAKLLVGQNYRIEAGINDATPFTLTYVDGGTYPVNNVTINWTGCSQNGGSCTPTTRFPAIVSITSQGLISSCYSGVPNTLNFTLTNQKNVTIYANNTGGNLASQLVNWDYEVFENSRTFNSTTYETAHETYSINVTANSSLTNVFLNYNGTNYAAANQGGGVWLKSLDIISSYVGTNTIYWNFTYSGSNFVSDNSTQIVNYTILGLCNATLTIPYINFTFKDEVLLTPLTATINSLTFNYWLGTGNIFKTLSYSNATINPSYAFCFTPTNKSIGFNYTIQYQNGTTYPAKTSSASRTLTNVTTNTTLYLLGSSTGIYVTFQVLNLASQPISGALIGVTNEILNIASGTTDGSGGITFFLNPSTTYTITASKSGYPNSINVITPTQSSYTITLGQSGIQTNITDLSQGITFSTNPSTSYLINNTNYIFNFTLASTYWEVDEFGFSLTGNNATSLGSTSASTNGGTVTVNANSNNYTSITMNYYYLINGSYMNFTRQWAVQNSEGTGWSIANFFTDLSAYLTSGLFGLTPWGLDLIVFMTIFLITGAVSWKFGLNSPAIILGVLTSLVFLFDVALGLIVYPSALTTITNHPATWVLTIVLIGFIVKEAYT